MTEREALKNIYEIWAGSEGMPVPETAVEAYLLHLLNQVRDEASKALAEPVELNKNLSKDAENALREFGLKVAGGVWAMAAPSEQIDVTGIIKFVDEVIKNG